MEKKNLKELSVGELNVKLREEHEEQMSLRLKEAMGQVKKSHLIQEKRKNIARIETELRRKGLN